MARWQPDKGGKAAIISRVRGFRKCVLIRLACSSTLDWQPVGCLEYIQC